MVARHAGARYEKTALSDLKGAWGNLRNEVVEAGPFPDWESILFHIDEAMSWESVRNLEQMRNTLLVIHNIAAQSEVPIGLSSGTIRLGNNGGPRPDL
jgi:hypothetical protein